MTGEQPRKILVVEDDADISSLLELHLRDMGFATVVAPDGETALEHLEAGSFSLLILDIMLPGIDGIEICRRVRSQADYIPILMLTCRSSELDRVLGLEMGADDYMTKPFSIRELQARVKALLRRVDSLRQGGEEKVRKLIKAGGLTIDTERHKVTLDERKVHLTTKEFSLLVLFASNPGLVFTRSRLLDSVWGYGYEGYEHTVNSHINRLRAKIEEDPTRPRYILTVRGVGYKFTEEGRGP